MGLREIQVIFISIFIDISEKLKRFLFEGPTSIRKPFQREAVIARKKRILLCGI
jgi:hypothetical protein